MNAFYQAVISFTSQNLGRRNFDRIKRSLLIGLACVHSHGRFARTCADLLRSRADGNIYEHRGCNRGRTRAFRLCRLYIFPLRNHGLPCRRSARNRYSFAPMVVSLMGACVLRLVWIATVFNIPEYHVVETVYISYPISWIVTAIDIRIVRRYTPSALSSFFAGSKTQISARGRTRALRISENILETY